MFREIQIKNFRGLKDSPRLQLAPLTVFTGSEGSGKSSVGHLLTMLSQTIHTSDPNIVLYPGNQDSTLQLGTQSSILYNNAEGPLEFSYRFELPNYLLIEDPEKDKFGVPTQYLFGESIHFHCTLDQFNAQYFSVDRFIYELYDTETKVLTASTHRSVITTKNKSLTQFTVETDGYILKNRTGRPWLQQRPKYFYGFPEALPTYYKNSSGLFELNKAHEATLRNIYYVGSDRTRFNTLHIWSGLQRADVGHDGAHTVNVLLGAANKEISLGERRRNQPVQAIVNDLLQRLQLAHAIHIEDIEAVENGYTIKITARKSKQVVNLPAAGKAIAQVLPILVQCFCAPSNSTIVLDAIETHLSPQSQALLADVLLDVIRSKEDGKDRNIQLIVSTHSEAFLRRLQRRIAEGGIPQEMVCAYHTTNYRRGVDIKQIPLITANHLNDLSQYFTFVDDDRQLTIEVADNLPSVDKRTLVQPIKPEPKPVAKKSTRGPGRPKGSKNKPTSEAEDKPKRRPGRPKGSKNKPKAHTDNSIETTVKRGPGRPKGSKNKPKTSTETSIEATVKRGPGRPKGSKNKNSKPKEVRTVRDAKPKQTKENKRAQRLKSRHSDKLN